MFLVPWLLYSANDSVATVRTSQYRLRTDVLRLRFFPHRDTQREAADSILIQQTINHAELSNEQGKHK